MGWMDGWMDGWMGGCLAFEIMENKVTVLMFLVYHFIVNAVLLSMLEPCKIDKSITPASCSLILNSSIHLKQIQSRVAVWFRLP